MKLHITDLGARYRVRKAYRTPFHSGSLWHGVLGHAFRQSACVASGKCVEACQFPSSCTATRFFASPHPDALPTLPNRVAQQTGTPPPRVIPLVPSVGGEQFAVGQDVSLVIRVFGPLSEKDKIALHAGLAAVADYPIGTDAGQIAFVAPVPATTAIIDTRAENLSLAPEHENRLRVTFETPLCIKVRAKDGRKIMLRDISFAALFGALHRRLTLLCSWFGEYLPEDDLRFSELRQRAQRVQTLQHHLREPDWARASNRSGCRYAMEGLLGSSVYAGTLTHFVPFLELAAFTHIGSDTSFGLGRTRFEILDLCAPLVREAVSPVDSTVPARI